MKRFRNIGRLSLLPEYVLTLFLFFGSFNLQGAIAETPISHAEVAYIEWVAQNQELESFKDVPEAKEKSLSTVYHLLGTSSYRQDFLRALLIQHGLALIAYKDQQGKQLHLYSSNSLMGVLPLILYTPEDDLAISIA